MNQPKLSIYVESPDRDAPPDDRKRYELIERRAEFLEQVLNEALPALLDWAEVELNAAAGRVVESLNG